MASEVWVTDALSGTPIADEHRKVEAALRQADPIVERFDVALYSAGVVAAARTWWGDMMRTEYESATVFIDLCTQLREIAAPLDVQAVTLRMAQDELRHAAVCANVIRQMGGEPRIALAPARRSTPHSDCTREESALRQVIYGCCLGETVNAARLVKRMSETGDPFVRDSFRLLLADERLHAQFGFWYLESRRGWLDARPEVKLSLGRYLRYAFAALEQQMGGVPVGARPPSDEECAIGLPDLTDLSATFQETMLNAVVPGLERFGIAAREAWAARGLSPDPA